MGMKPKFRPPRPGFPRGPHEGSSPGWPHVEGPATRPAKLTAGVPLARLVKRSLVQAPELVMLSGQKSPAADRFRQLRTLVADAGQVIVVSSPSRGDGRSFVAINLALAFCADPENEILLIDADVRRPSLDDWLRPKPALGLTEILEARTELEHVVLDIKNSPLKVLPAGAPVRDPLELISSPSATAMMMELRQRYRKIIIDTPPVLPSIDASVIAKLGDGVLLVTRSNATTVPLYRQAIDALAPTPIIGTVVNCAVPGLADRYWSPKTTPVRPVRRVTSVSDTSRRVPIAPPEPLAAAPRPGARADSAVEALHHSMTETPGSGESKKPKPLSLSDALAEPRSAGSREPARRSKPRPLSDVLSSARPDAPTGTHPLPLSAAIGLPPTERTAKPRPPATGANPAPPESKAPARPGPAAHAEPLARPAHPARPAQTATPQPIAPPVPPQRRAPMATSRTWAPPEQPLRPAPTAQPQTTARPEQTKKPAPTAKPPSTTPLVQPQRPAPTAKPPSTTPLAQPQRPAPTAKPQPTTPLVQPQRPAPTAKPPSTTPPEPKAKPERTPWPRPLARPFSLRRKRGRSEPPDQAAPPGGVSHDGSGGFVFSPPSKDGDKK